MKSKEFNDKLDMLERKTKRVRTTLADLREKEEKLNKELDELLLAKRRMLEKELAKQEKNIFKKGRD